MKKNLFSGAFLSRAVCAAVVAGAALMSQTLSYAQGPSDSEEGIDWPAGQAFPHFAAPAGELAGLDMAAAALPFEERVMFSSLQGIVNRTRPRLFLFSEEREGKYKWPGILGLEIKEVPAEERFSIVTSFADELKGVVLYDPSKSAHYANLASTVAGIEDALPVTRELYGTLREHGLDLPVVADFTGLKYDKPQEIYEYLYENWWGRCTRRLLVSLSPKLAYVRDLAVASGAAVVWLDPRKWPENTVLRKFLKTMTPGESIVTGWYAEERSGIGLATEYGLSTVPSDFYENSTVYAGMSHEIDYPKVPKMPRLENKIYLAVFLSDGDNIQYCQHAMSQLWDKEGRGSMPINWTVSPALVDLGPGILNHYYRTATPGDFFASGPSGLGYSLIYDAHNYVWNSTSGSAFTPYADLTGRYLEKSGLRVVTIWDEVSQEQMDAYADKCRYLYGLTQQDWERRPYKVPAYIGGGRLPFIPNLPCYASGVDVIYSFWEDDISQFDGSAPLFLSAQGESWKMGPDNIAILKDRLEKLSPGNIVICRGDHFFNLYNQAHHLPFNLALLPLMRITASPSSSDPEAAADGSVSESCMWTCQGEDAWVQMDFGQEYLINRYVVRHAGAAGLPSDLDTRAFRVEASSDGLHWTAVDRQDCIMESATDRDIAPAAARYVRICVEDPGSDGVARIADVEVYGISLPGKNNFSKRK